MRDIIRLPAEHYLQLIKDKKPFSLARFGDGEVLCMFREILHENCDGSRFMPQLVEPMKQIFRNQYAYYHCFLRCTFDFSEKAFRKFFEATCPDMAIYDGEIWQELSMGGRITELIETISEYECVFIGGSHFENIHLLKGFKKHPHYIPVPDKDSILEFERIIMDIHNQYVAGKRMFLFSAGYTSKILIDVLFEYIGHDTFMIDMGSVFDPYLGRLSRSGMQVTGFEFYQPYTNLELI